MMSCAESGWDEKTHPKKQHLDRKPLKKLCLVRSWEGAPRRHVFQFLLQRGNDKKSNNPSDVPEIQLFKSCNVLVQRQELAHVAFVKLYWSFMCD